MEALKDSKGNPRLDEKNRRIIAENVPIIFSAEIVEESNE